MVVLLVGFYGDLVEDLLNAHRDYRVLVIEEADLIESLDFSLFRNSKFDIRPGAYQQSLEAVAVGLDWFRSEPFDAVVAGREYGVRSAQMIAAEIGLRGPSRTATELSTDKLAMREFASRYGLTKGRYSAVNNLADIEAFMGDVPIVLKPRSRHASLGVVRINTREEISAAWQQAQESHQQGGLTQGRDLHWDYMVEEFVSGFDEFSLETLIRDGKVVFSNITRKMMDASRHFSPVGHVVPACVSESMSETLRNTENSFLRCIEVADGFVHSEWIVTERGPHLIEFAVRFPGGGLSRLIEYVYGINLAEAWVRLLAGREIPSHKPPGAVTAVLYFSGREGRLISVDGFDFLKSSDWVIDHRLLTPTGSRISDIRNSLDRVGYVMIKGNTYGELEARLRVIRDAVTVQVEL